MISPLYKSRTGDKYSFWQAGETTERFYTLSEKIKFIEGAMSKNAELRAAIVDYAKIRPVFEEFKAKK